MARVGRRQSLKLLPGLPFGCRTPRTWAIPAAFPAVLTGSWVGSGVARTRTGVDVGTQCQPLFLFMNRATQVKQ